MDENTTLAERLGRAEVSIQALERTVSDLSGRVAALSTPAQQAAVVQRAVEQVYCPRCHGGNPPGARYCAWCYLALPAGLGQQTIAEDISAEEPPLVAALTGVPSGTTGAMGAPDIANPYAGSGQSTMRPTTPLPPLAAPVSPPTARPAFDFLKTSEFWLNKVGIALLLFGVAFLFKYSIDRGWLTPEIRIAIGLAVGTVLLAVGLRLQEGRPHFSQVLQGGAVGAYYITGFAAYQLFNPPLVPYEVAFGFMVGVTVLAFVLALHADNAVLSLIGTAGGLATPFVLYHGQSAVAGLMAYTSLLLSGAVLVYFFKGWRSLLWTSFMCGLLVLMQGLDASLAADRVTSNNKLAIEIAVVIYVILYWGGTMLHDVLASRDAKRWPSPTSSMASADVRALLDASAHFMAALLPFIAIWFSITLWGGDLSRQQWGMIALAYAALYGVIAWLIRRDTPRLAYVHAMMAIFLGSVSLIGLLEGNTLFVAAAAEVVVLHFTAKRLKDLGTAMFGHAIFGLVAIALAVDLVFDFSVTDSALVDLGVIALIAAASFAAAPGKASILYRNVVNIAFVAWLWQVLSPQPYGTGYLLVAWAAYAVGLMVLARRLPRTFAREETSYPAHLIMLLGVWLFADRIVLGPAGSPALLNWNTLLDVAFLAGLFAASILSPVRRFGLSIYLVAVHAGVLALLARELGALPSGNAYISIAWGVYGIALFVAGISGLIHAHRMELTTGGIVTFLLVVAKLFLVDLSSLDPVWRILLFLGFGGAFLVLSYFFQNSIRKGLEQMETPQTQPGGTTLHHGGTA